MADMPKRIQRSRAKGSRLPAGAVVVTRPGRWGNPFKVGGDRFDAATNSFRPIRDIADAVDAYRQMVDWDPDAPSYWPTDEGRLEIWGGYTDGHTNRKTIRKFLAGKDLACWCPLDQPCHADVLLEIANRHTRARIALRCACGNAVLRAREETDPPLAAECWTSLCNLCDGGDFEALAYFDGTGREVSGDPETFSA
jgi:hypothetical protein